MKAKLVMPKFYFYTRKASKQIGISISIVAILLLSGCLDKKQFSIAQLQEDDKKIAECLKQQKSLQKPVEVIQSKQESGSPIAFVRIRPDITGISAIGVDGDFAQYDIPNLTLLNRRVLNTVSLVATEIDPKGQLMISGEGYSAGIRIAYPNYKSGQALFRFGNGLILWDIQKDNVITSQIPLPYTYSHVVISPNTDEVLVAEENTMYALLALPSLATKGEFGGGYPESGPHSWEALAYDEVGEYIAYAGTHGIVGVAKVNRAIEPYQLQNEILLEKTNSEHFIWPNSPVRPLSMAFDPYRKYVAVLRSDGVLLYSLSMPSYKVYLGSGSNGMSGIIRFRPDGKMVAVGDEQGLRLFDISTQKLISHFNDISYAIDFSRDGRYLISGDDKGKLHLYDFCRQ